MRADISISAAGNWTLHVGIPKTHGWGYSAFALMTHEIGHVASGSNNPADGWKETWGSRTLVRARELATDCIAEYWLTPYLARHEGGDRLSPIGAGGYSDVSCLGNEKQLADSKSMTGQE